MEENSFHGFIGKSPVMCSVYDALARMVKSQAPVFISGETGTGKELAAQALHAGEPFIALNCAAIPNELLESEIFGHVKGAFTGAITDRAGAAKQADGGVLFLDEITEMQAALQAKLLRFAQTGVFTPVGGAQAVKVNVRFVSTTNRDAAEAVREGRLRQDLYYRLAPLTLHLPPLRARGNDLFLLAEYFLEKITREEGKGFKKISDAANGALAQHSWPGNVRELEGVIRNAVVMCDGEVLEKEMLKIKVCEQEHVLFPDIIRPFAEVEREVIEKAVGLCGGNITEAALKLGLNPSTIHRKRKGWGR